MADGSQVPYSTYGKDVVDDCKSRFRQLGPKRRGFDPHCQDVARYTQPRLGVNLSTTVSQDGTVRVTGNAGKEVNSRLLDARGIRASRTLANGMTTGLVSSSTPWFKLAPPDPDMNKNQEVKEWIAEVEKRLYALFSSTNFYTSAKEGFLELGVFGTSATFMEESFEYRAVTHTLTWGQYWIGLNAANFPDSLYRLVPMTAGQVRERFPDKRCWSKKVRDALDNKKTEQAINVYHAVEPNQDRLTGKLDSRNMPFRSVWWEPDGDCALRLGGYVDRPFWAPRWDVSAGEDYGRSPGMEALPDLRQLQLANLRKQQAMDYGITPALVGPTSLNNTHANLAPRGLTLMANVDRAPIAPIWQVDPRMIGELKEDIQETRQAVDETFFVPLLQAITNMPGIQPRNVEEIASRNEEALRLLGPVTERNQNEQQRVSIDRAFGMLLRTGQLPPVPEPLMGMPLMVKFISPLAQMQRAIGVGAIERGWSFIGTMAAANPEVLDKWDFDAAVDAYTDLIGTPPTLVKTEDQVAASRQARAQQAKMAQMAAAAPAAADAATAVKTLSEADMGDGTTALGRITGTRPAV